MGKYTDVDDKVYTAYIFTCIIGRIVDKLMSNFINANTVPKLWLALEAHFNMQMMFLTVVDISQLFKVNKHISKFNEALDKLEQLYASLKSNGDVPDDKTYLSAINNVTPQLYCHVTSIYVMAVEAYNAANLHAL